MAKRRLLLLIIGAGSCWCLGHVARPAVTSEVPEVPPWQKEYSGEEATGPNVIAPWQFVPGEEYRDNSGHGHDLQLRGQSRFSPNGIFGHCLECFASHGNRETAGGAAVKNHPALSPAGPFTLEMWIRPKPQIAECDLAFLLDKKYLHYPRDTPEANRDYCLYLRRAGPGRFRLVAYLGYGTDSAEFVSREFIFEPLRWVHVAFSYDGAGIGRFFLNGEPIGRTAQPGQGPIAPGRYDLVIGDRYGSLYAGFPGWIDQVRILGTVAPWAGGGLEIEPATLCRTSFLRMESPAEVRLVIRNPFSERLNNVKVVWQFHHQRGEKLIERADAHEEIALPVPVDTRLRPDRYPLRVVVTATHQGKPLQL